MKFVCSLRAFWLIRCDSETDGIVRMREAVRDHTFPPYAALICALCTVLRLPCGNCFTGRQALFVYLSKGRDHTMTPHTFYMQRAIQLARRGIGFVNPNPLVGAVIIKDGRIIGAGWHAKYGDLHAERHALQNCTQSPAGAVLYVTLEPCCHHGKQPPCTEAILQSGIHKVYIGSRDPNPLVSGKGVQFLRENGVEVVTDFLRAQCDALNPIFFHYITTGMPYTILKYAMTADGKIACAGGSSKWVTGELARAHVQQTRKRVAAICVGIDTVLADDPMLNCRCKNPSQPVRVVLDTHLRIPLDCRLVQTASEIPVVVCCHALDTAKKAALEARGVIVREVSAQDGHVSMQESLAMLGRQGIDSVLIEGGAAIHAAACRAACVDRLQVYLAPKLFGGDGLSPVGCMGIADPSQAMRFGAPSVTRLGDDLLLEYEKKE